tara:strand:+ start:8123 stop:8434 length:312 start_codon:yes stop_codon:yes gene_type:complete
MTIQEYLIKMEEQLENSLSDNLRKYIPTILEKIEDIALKQFIKEGDPVLDLQQFKRIFDKIMTESLNKELEKNKRIVISEGIFQTVIVKRDTDDIMTFSYCLN